MYYYHNTRNRNFSYDQVSYVECIKKLEIEKIDQLLYEIELILK